MQTWQKIRNIPTSEAIKILAEEWLQRQPPPGLSKEVKVPYKFYTSTTGNQAVSSDTITTALLQNKPDDLNHMWKNAGLVDFYENKVKPDVNYGWYVLKHKYNVINPGLEMGVSPFKLIAHDWSKFKPSIYQPYADYWFGPKGRKGANTPETYKSFRIAAGEHYKSEAHHANRLGLPKDLQTELESVADWYSVTKTNDPQTPDFPTWFTANREKFKSKLSPAALMTIDQKVANGESWWNIF